MAVEDAADLAAFFDSDDWTEDATYTPAGGAAVAILAIVNRGHEEASVGDELGVNLPAMRALARASEVPSPAPGDTLVLGATTYRVTQADQDALGAIWTLWLAAQ